MPRFLGPGGVAPDLTDLSVPDAALAWVAAGFSVFPCVAVGFDERKQKWSKRPHPMLDVLDAPRGEGGWKLATQISEQVRAWWEIDPHALIGIPPGMAGAVVLDADGPDGVASLYERGNQGEDSFDLTTTFQTRTPGDGGGLHVWFRKNPGTEKIIGNGRLTHIRGEARADRGYVIAPPSTLPDGGQYSVASSTRLLEYLPGWAGFELPWEDAEDRRSIADITTGAQVAWLASHSPAALVVGDDSAGRELVEKGVQAILGAVEGDENEGRDPRMKQWVGRIITASQNGAIHINLEEALARLRDAFVEVKPRAAHDFDRFLGDALALRVAEDSGHYFDVELREITPEEQARADEQEKVRAGVAVIQVSAPGSVPGPGEIEIPEGFRAYRPGDMSGQIIPPDEDRILIGPLGRWLEMVVPNTEASLTGMGIGALVALSAWYGRDFHLEVGDIDHPLRLMAVQVGWTAKARKGTTDRQVRKLLREIDPDFAAKNVHSGFGSGEALIERVSDPRRNKAGEVTGGTEDQRLWINEGEFSKMLRISNRDGVILGDIIRLGFDGEAPIENHTKGRHLKSSEHALGVFGGITPEELVELFPVLGATSGSGNRYLWAWAEATQLLPLGGTRVSLTKVAADIRVSRASYRGSHVLTYTPEAMGWWKHMYGTLRNVTFAPEAMRNLLSRSTDHVNRIAAVYALTEGEQQVTVRHMEAGWAWVEHSVSVVTAALGGLIRDPLAGRILASLRSHPGKASSLSELHRVFDRNETAASIRSALDELEALGLAHTSKVETGKPGRPSEVTIAITNDSLGKPTGNYFVPRQRLVPKPEEGIGRTTYEKNSHIESDRGGLRGGTKKLTPSRYPSRGLEADIPEAPGTEPISPPPPRHSRVRGGSSDIQISAGPQLSIPAVESGEPLYLCPDCQAVAMGLTRDRSMLICLECEYGISTNVYEEQHGAI